MTNMTEAWLNKPCNNKECSGHYKNTKTFSEWWMVCSECNNFFFLYKPMPHQLRFHRDPAKFKLFGGGFGSSKTVTVAAEFVYLALTTPNGVGLVGASTFPQLERTSKKQVTDMIPSEFIERVDKKNNVMTLTNGYEIMFRSFDDEQKLRSLNLCHVIMEEANGTNFAIFTQLQTRLRHTATKDHKILIATNPDNNWVRTELLMKSARIYGANEKYVRKSEDINPNISTHIARTAMNTYLPPNYEKDIAVGKADWWVAKFLNGSFNFSEGAVYPNILSSIVDISPEEIKHNVKTKGWKVLGSSDFGLRDPTTLILFAIDPVNGVVYAYDEYYKNQLPVPHHAREMKKRMEHIPLGALQGLVGDPSGKRKNINDRRSIFDHYAEYGIFFEPGDNRIDAGIMKVYSYLEMGKLKILKHMVNTIEEMTNYHYKPTDMNEVRDNKPADGEDHMCFIAGTKITTEFGDLPIEDVKIGDKVLTRHGLKPVYASAKTGIDEEVYEVTLSNGRILTATGNHPVWVKGKGFCAIDTLRYSDIVEVLEDWSEDRWNTRVLNGTEERGQSILTKNTLKATQHGSTGRYGNSIMDLFQKVITSTILTMTRPTTTSATLKSLKKAHTTGCIWRLGFKISQSWRMLENIWRKSDHLLRNGTLQKKGERGMLKMERRATLREKLLSTLANIAPNRTRQQHLDTTDSAQMLASLLSDERVVLTMWRNCVKYAEIISLETSTLEQQRVREFVRVLKVTKLETKYDVYGLSVADSHEYYANGVLVSNCDTVRYGIQTLPDDPDMLKSATYGLSDFRQTNTEEHLPYELQDDMMDNYSSSSSWLNY